MFEVQMTAIDAAAVDKLLREVDLDLADSVTREVVSISMSHRVRAPELLFVAATLVMNVFHGQDDYQRALTLIAFSRLLEKMTQAADAGELVPIASRPTN